MAKKATSTKKKKTAPKKTIKETKKVSTPLPNAFELFKPSTNAFVLNIGTFLGLFFIPILIVFGAGLLAFSLVIFSLSLRSVEMLGVGFALIFVFLLAAAMVGVLLAPAIPLTQLCSARGEKLELKPAIRGGLHYFWRFYGVSISVGFMVFFGLLFFIVPGVIFIRRYFLSWYVLIDKDTRVFESMRISSATTKGHNGAIWGVIGVNILIGMISVIPWLGGAVSAVLQTLYSCSPALRYEQLKKT